VIRLLHATLGATLLVLLGASSQTGPAAPTPSAKKPLILLYDEMPDTGRLERILELRSFPYRIVYQSVDPEAGKTGRINIVALLAAIRKDAEQGLPDWGMLDFEDPFHALLQEGPDSDACRRTVQNMVEAMQAVRATFPGTKWTFYGMPWLPYWLDKGQDWSAGSTESKRKTLETATRIYQPIIESMDWVSPTIYPKYEPTSMPGMPPQVVREQGRAWRAAQVGLARLLGKDRPVIPNVCPWWTPGGKARFCTVVAPNEFIEDQVEPAVRMGASGVALWGSLGYTIRRITDSDQSKYSKEKDFGTTEWRAAVTSDYLGGAAPTDWSAPDVRAKVSSALCGTMLRALDDIRVWERDGTVPRVGAGR
jgi:hypothetical protein